MLGRRPSLYAELSILRGNDIMNTFMAKEAARIAYLALCSQVHVLLEDRDRIEMKGGNADEIRDQIDNLEHEKNTLENFINGE